MLRTLRRHCGGPGSIPGRGAKIPRVARHSKDKKGQRDLGSNQERTCSYKDQTGAALAAAGLLSK